MSKTVRKKPAHERHAPAAPRGDSLGALAAALGVPRFALRLAGAERWKRLPAETWPRHRCD